VTTLAGTPDGAGASESGAAELAARHGLTRVGLDTPFRPYLRQLWGRRHFIGAYARARIQQENARNKLGEVWLVLNPILNAAVFYFIFGVLLKTSRGVDNYVAFLIIGVFFFTYLQRSISAGASSVSGNLNLIRAFHFPRAVLPLATTVKQLMQLGYSTIVLIVIVLATGEPLTWKWLLLPVTIALLTLFAAGLSLAAARVNTVFNDFSNFLPFLLRAWLYLSGVFFNIQAFGENWPEWARTILLYQPGAIYLECARVALMDSYSAPTDIWWWAIGWAVGAFTIGFVFFYRAEGRYGRG
jgi:teichoic acid transport system permease protein